MYDLQINTAIENSHTIRNTLYVFGLRHSAEKFVLNSKILPNDITTGEPAMLIGLKKVDFYIEGSVDVSLRAYISSLYLNNRSMTISLSVNGLRLQ